jgi:hypothetical protein
MLRNRDFEIVSNALSGYKIAPFVHQRSLGKLDRSGYCLFRVESFLGEGYSIRDAPVGIARWRFSFVLTRPYRDLDLTSAMEAGLADRIRIFGSVSVRND